MHISRIQTTYRNSQHLGIAYLAYAQLIIFISIRFNTLVLMRVEIRRSVLLKIFMDETLFSQSPGVKAQRSRHRYAAPRPRLLNLAVLFAIRLYRCQYFGLSSITLSLHSLSPRMTEDSSFTSTDRFNACSNIALVQPTVHSQYQCGTSPPNCFLRWQ